GAGRLGGAEPTEEGVFGGDDDLLDGVVAPLDGLGDEGGEGGGDDAADGDADDGAGDPEEGGDDGGGHRAGGRSEDLSDADLHGPLGADEGGAEAALALGDRLGPAFPGVTAAVG